MQDIRTLVRLQLTFVALFALGKHFLRPFVLERDSPTWADITVLSLPNFFEGVIGVITITALGLYFLGSQGKDLKKEWVYFFALVVSAIYTLTQEFKLHNLGGNNVYDPYDVLFSLIGLVTGFLLLLWLRPSYDQSGR